MAAAACRRAEGGRWRCWTRAEGNDAGTIGQREQGGGGTEWGWVVVEERIRLGCYIPRVCGNMRLYVPLTGQPINRVVPMLALRAEFVAQALALHRSVPDTGTIIFMSCRVVSGSCFFGPCSCRSIVLVPNGHL
jgi:hypothetical protein